MGVNVSAIKIHYPQLSEAELLSIHYSKYFGGELCPRGEFANVGF